MQSADFKVSAAASTSAGFSASFAPFTTRMRFCACGFCCAHGTRTVSDRDGLFELRAADWSLVERYRFGSRTADYMICRRCGSYVAAVCATRTGLRAVVNVNCLDDRAAFTRSPAAPGYDGGPM